MGFLLVFSAGCLPCESRVSEGLLYELRALMLEEEQRAAACLSRRRPLPAFQTPPFVASCAFKVRSWSCSPHLKCPTPTSTRSRERHISISAGAGSFSFLPGFGQVPARCCWLVVLCMVLIPAMWSRAHRTIRINAPIPPHPLSHLFPCVHSHYLSRLSMSLGIRGFLRLTYTLYL